MHKENFPEINEAINIAILKNQSHTYIYLQTDNNIKNHMAITNIE